MSTERAPRRRTASAKQPESGAPVSTGQWDTPWHADTDAAGWQTVYRGRRQRRLVRSVLELELTPDQWTWLDHTAEAAGLAPHDVLSKLIDAARAVPAAETPATK